MQLAAGADVRRERTDPVQALGGLREVEHAIVGLELRRVGRLALLRPEDRVGQHLVEQLDRELGCASVDSPGVVLRREQEPALGGDRAGVELLHRLVDRDARLGVTRHQRALDRGGAAPARQERRVHVQPEAAVEQLFGDQQSRTRRRRPCRPEARARRSAGRAGARGSRAAPPRPWPEARRPCGRAPPAGRAASAAQRCHAGRRAARARPRRTVPWRLRPASCGGG